MPRKRQRIRDAKRFADREIFRIEKAFGQDEGFADDEISRSLSSARTLFSNSPDMLETFIRTLRRHAMRKGYPADFYETREEALSGGR